MSETPGELRPIGPQRSLGCDDVWRGSFVEAFSGRKHGVYPPPSDTNYMKARGRGPFSDSGRGAWLTITGSPRTNLT